jgi:glycosyltransferase involved in cell wall biosynthesis
LAERLPTISIVTPSYNQAEFVGEAIASVLEQSYPRLEYVVIDGESSDGSVEIIQHHADRLAYWCSEPDSGQYDAINKGFRYTSGEVMAWLNSDDKLLAGSLSVVGRIFGAFPQVEWISSRYPLAWNRHGEPCAVKDVGGFSRRSFFRGAMLPHGRWYAREFIQQESTFWRRSLWDRAGGYLETSLALAADFELWARFYQHADLYAVSAPLGGFRLHPDQKTAQRMNEYVTEAESLLKRYGGVTYHPLESAVRRLSAWLAGGYSLGGSGRWRRGVLVGLGIAHQNASIFWAGERWELVRDHLI